MTRLAAVDIGSLTVRLAVAEAGAPGKFQVVLHRREITGLGREVDASGALGQADQDRTLKALEGFARDMAAQVVDKGQAVATQAVRQAQNGQEFLEAAAKVLNLPALLLTPEEEARFTLAGVLSTLDPKYSEAGPLLVFDLGGGSLEFILIRPGEEPVVAGLPLGVLSVSRTRPLGDPPQAFIVDDLKREMRRAVQDFYQRYFRKFVENPPLLVGTAGTVTTLAAMALEMDEYDPQRVNNYFAPGAGGRHGGGAQPVAGKETGLDPRPRTRQGRGHSSRSPHRPGHPGHRGPGSSGVRGRRAAGGGAGGAGPVTQDYFLTNKPR